MKLLISISALAVFLGCYSSVWAQTPTNSPDVIKELLAAPAPAPQPPNANPGLDTNKRTLDFYDKANVPPDDAPLEDLFDYWSRWTRGDIRPSETVRQRLLDGYVDDLRTLAFLLPLFPTSEKSAEKIKQAFDRSASTGNPKLDEYRNEVRRWLVFNSKYFIDELLSQATNVKDNEEMGYVDNKEALMALARIDWSMAEPLLNTLVTSDQQRSSTCALALLYHHSIDEKDAGTELKLRGKLLSIASNQSFPGRARSDAIEALSNSEWSGRDEWYLSLFNDESLQLLRDGLFGIPSLSTLLEREPDKWVPVLAKLVAGKDRNSQQAAAIYLVRFVIEHPRRDAILPLLRWLTEPEWIPLATLKASFMRKLAELDIPESVPGLIWIAENDPELGPWAASPLARYKDARAIPALKKVLAEVREDLRPLVLEGLIGSGGITEAEQLEALEAYATKLTTAAGREEDQRYPVYGAPPLPLQVSIGRYVAKLPNPPDTLVRAVLTRAKSLRKTNAALSSALLEVAHNWQGRQIDLDLIDRIAGNTAEAKTIITALERRDFLRESVKTELQLLIATSGIPKGIGAVLLANHDVASSILSSRDQSAQMGLLAAARLTQTPLSIDQVGPLLKSKNSILALAAEHYLLAEDSKAARTLLWQHYPQQSFVTGWRENIQLIGGSNFDRIGKKEEKLRAELLKTGGPLEIFAFLPNNEDFSYVLRIYADKAVYTFYEDSSRYRERVVSKAELSNFRQYVSTNGLIDSGPQFGECHHNCWATQFLMLSKGAGRRVFSHQEIGTTNVMRKEFERLGIGAGTTTHYNIAQEIKGLELLYADQSLTVLDVWQRDNEIRILVEPAETEAVAYNLEDEDDDALALRWQREYAQSKARLSWRILEDKDARSRTSAPDGYSTFDYTRFPFDRNDSSARRDERQIQVLGPDSILIARNYDGLWKQVAGTKPVRISGEDGAYANPLVTPDGKWAVISKTDTQGSGYLVRLNLETGHEFRVQIEPANQLDAIAFVPRHDKILLRSARDSTDLSSGRPAGPKVAQYHLIDPKTGEVQSISGEFAPLRHAGQRFLQPTGEPDQYWAAIPYNTKNQTVVGRYNLKDFSFKPVLTVPQISFESMSMWVDEKQQKLYFVYKGQLLRLPLQNTP